VETLFGAEPSLHTAGLVFGEEVTSVVVVVLVTGVIVYDADGEDTGELESSNRFEK
jgi:hypothetical protein